MIPPPSAHARACADGEGTTSLRGGTEPVVSWPAVNRFDALGYGTHLILDGFRADPASLGEATLIEEVVRDLGARLESGAPGDTLVLRVAGGQARGFSAALVQGESHLCVHTFPALHKLTLAAFSTRNVPVDAFSSVFRHRFAVGRTESRVHGRARLLPDEPHLLERILRGDRAFARLRLRDLLTA